MNQLEIIREAYINNTGKVWHKRDNIDDTPAYKLQAGETISWNDFHSRSIEHAEFESLTVEHILNGNYFFISDLMCGSDYSGEALTKSNYRVMLDEAKEEQYSLGIDVNAGYFPISGDYGAYGIAFPLLSPLMACWHRIEALDRYPLLSGDDLSYLEIELAGEAWKDVGVFDFRSALAREFGVDASNSSPEDLWSLYSSADIVQDGSYPITEVGCAVSFGIDRVVRRLQTSDVLAVPGMIDEENNEESHISKRVETSFHPEEKPQLKGAYTVCLTQEEIEQSKDLF